MQAVARKLLATTMEGRKWEKAKKCQKPTLRGFDPLQRKLAETKTSQKEHNRPEIETKHENSRKAISSSPFFVIRKRMLV
jgi:hypothetical protein